MENEKEKRHPKTFFGRNATMALQQTLTVFEALDSAPGCGTGASHEIDIAAAVRFSIETAKEFTNGTCAFYDPQEFVKITELYGSMKILQTAGSAQNHG
ncbi:hypothetical protein QD47_18450 [Paenibacillus terrae]|uniref:Uncharacterized protein n=1 Tax=Paenibacillus terrae TaxID=159743 RepID=A0A0D7WYX0_9BACL|nr:hypothetical protein QD47_18450 [Paenibacillus terrae]